MKAFVKARGQTDIKSGSNHAGSNKRGENTAANSKASK